MATIIKKTFSLTFSEMMFLETNTGYEFFGNMPDA